MQSKGVFYFPDLHLQNCTAQLQGSNKRGEQNLDFLRKKCKDFHFPILHACACALAVRRSHSERQNGDKLSKYTAGSKAYTYKSTQLICIQFNNLYKLYNVNICIDALDHNILFWSNELEAKFLDIKYKKEFLMSILWDEFQNSLRKAFKITVFKNNVDLKV